MLGLTWLWLQTPWKCPIFPALATLYQCWFNFLKIEGFISMEIINQLSHFDIRYRNGKKNRFIYLFFLH